MSSHLREGSINARSVPGTDVRAGRDFEHSLNYIVLRKISNWVSKMIPGTDRSNRPPHFGLGMNVKGALVALLSCEGPCML